MQNLEQQLSAVTVVHARNLKQQKTDRYFLQSLINPKIDASQ